jgi:predicted signal transduction protein with EAL and GGDEF domain
LLRELAERVAGCTRGYDLLARLGGDEFAIVASNLDDDLDMAVIADKISRALAEPMQLGGRRVVVSASMGIALYPADGERLEELLAHADMAMYQAKRAGRNRYEFYRAEFSARARDRVALEQALRDAQDGAGLALHYQPLVTVDDGKVVGAEALLRWHHPELGLLYPDRFIGLAEDTGLIVPMGRWVIHQAARQARLWNQGRALPLKVAVNVSTTQFLQDDLVAVVREALQQTGCQPDWLSIEVTESLLLEDNERIQRIFHELGTLGLQIAIDDFGTGYSALNYLSRFDVTILKIDRQFVRDIGADSRQAELVKAFVAIAQALGLGVVAEGVETAEQASFLRANGCSQAQGYLYGKPMAAEHFEQHLRDEAQGRQESRLG